MLSRTSFFLCSVVLVACTSTGNWTQTSPDYTHRERTLEVTSKSKLGLRTEAILAASKNCSAGGMRGRVIELIPDPQSFTKNQMEGDVTFRCE